jgi:hypothetical protein
VSSRGVLGFVDSVERSGLELHSFMLLRHGCVAAEGWWAPFRPELKHMLYSLSKSFTSTAIGLAVMEGRLSVDDPVVEFFPDKLPEQVSDNLAAMKVRHLLSMSTGHAEDTTGRLFTSKGPEWTRAFLALPVENPPGTHFVYNSGATYMLSAIITKLTGETLTNYLAPRLFEPLGIEGYNWDLSPEGINTGGWGLSIKTEDIAKLGQLYLNKGVWDGKRILSEDWVREATSKQISNSEGQNIDWTQGYGYQFWMCRHGAYRGDGMFGQYCIVMPEKAAVLAMTASVKDMQAVLNLVWQHILPAMGSAPLPPDDSALEALVQKTSSLAIPLPVAQTHSPAAQQVSGRTIPGTLPNGRQAAVTLEFQDDSCSIVIDDGSGKYALDCGLGRWAVSEKFLPARLPAGSGVFKMAIAGGWLDDHTFKAVVRFIEGPHAGAIIAHVGGNEPRVEFCEL